MGATSIEQYRQTGRPGGWMSVAPDRIRALETGKRDLSGLPKRARR